MIVLSLRGALQVIVAMHNRFPELFTPSFTNLLLQGLKPGASSAADKDIQEKENTARIIKQRTTLRIVGELEVIAIVRKAAGKAGSTGEITWVALRDLVSLHSSPLWKLRSRQRIVLQLTSDKEALPLVAPLAIAFAKHLGPLYLPPASPDSDSTDSVANDFPELGAGGDQPESDEAIVPRDVKDKFRKLLVAYFEALGKREQKLHLARVESLRCHTR